MHHDKKNYPYLSAFLGHCCHIHTTRSYLPFTRALLLLDGNVFCRKGKSRFQKDQWESNSPNPKRSYCLGTSSLLHVWVEHFVSHNVDWCVNLGSSTPGRHKPAGKPARRTAGRPWGKIGKSFTPLWAALILIILFFMNYWNISHNITIVCLPLTKFRDSPLHQARKKQLMFWLTYVYWNSDKLQTYTRSLKKKR